MFDQTLRNRDLRNSTRGLLIAGVIGIGARTIFRLSSALITFVFTQFHSPTLRKHSDIKV